jgi:protocatechuate 3,4-dioxygenase beta subunit
MKFGVTGALAALLAAGAGLTLAQNRQTGQPGAAAKATIEGIVIRSGAGQPLKGAQVSLLRASTANVPAALRGANLQLGTVLGNVAAIVATVSTDDSGRFLFTGVDPGEYRVSAEREGYARVQYGQRTVSGAGTPFAIEPGQRVSLQLQMSQAGVVSGRVFNPDNEPESQATVQAYAYQYAEGRRTLEQVAVAQTNDLGEYRLFWLQPGEYFIGVTSSRNALPGPVGKVDVAEARGARGAELQILRSIWGDRTLQPLVEALTPGGPVPVYYPGTIDPAAAIPVNVGIGTETRGVDFNLRPIPSLTIRGRVAAGFALGGRGQDGPGPVRGAAGRGGDVARFLTNAARSTSQVTITRIGGTRGGLLLNAGNTQVQPDGSFEIGGLAPGSYNLMATATDADGRQFTGRIRVDAVSADVNNVTIPVRAGIEVPGQITLEAQAPSGFAMSRLRISLVNEDSPLGALFGAAIGGAALAAAGIPGGGTSAAVEENGRFVLANVGAAEYRLSVAGLPAGTYVESARIGASDALSGPLSVADPQPLQILIGFSPGRVSGTVVDASRTPIAGITAVLVPEETRRGRLDLHFSASTDANGQFAFNTVPAGTYKVFAWEEVPDGAWQYADFIRRYEDRGQQVTVNRNGAVTVETRLISN